LNHEPLNMGSRQRNGLASGEAVLMSSPPSRSQIGAGIRHQDFAESGFGGWVDEKIEPVREAAPMLSPPQKKLHPQHLTISVDLAMATRYVQDVSEQADRVIGNTRKYVIGGESVA